MSELKDFMRQGDPLGDKRLQPPQGDAARALLDRAREHDGLLLGDPYEHGWVEQVGGDADGDHRGRRLRVLVGGGVVAAAVAGFVAALVLGGASTVRTVPAPAAPSPAVSEPEISTEFELTPSGFGPFVIGEPFGAGASEAGEMGGISLRLAGPCSSASSNDDAWLVNTDGESDRVSEVAVFDSRYLGFVDVEMDDTLDAVEARYGSGWPDRIAGAGQEFTSDIDGPNSLTFMFENDLLSAVWLLPDGSEINPHSCS